MGLAYLRKWRAVYSVYLKETLAYPATAFIWMLSDTVVAVLLPAVWLAASGPQGTVAGFDRREMVTYYLLTITLAQFVVCHLMWNIAGDIKEGFFSAQIVRPFSFLAHSAARNLAWRISKLVIFAPIGFFFFFAFLGTSSPSPLYWNFEFFLAVGLGHLLSFLSAYALSLITLWTVESFSIMEVYYVPEQILSGRLLPLSTLPGWALAVADVLYFKYTVAFPVEMLMGRLTVEEVWKGFAYQIGYCLLFFEIGRRMLRAGMRQYTGAGM